MERHYPARETINFSVFIGLALLHMWGIQFKLIKSIKVKNVNHIFVRFDV
jgi:hypothetical protein